MWGKYSWSSRLLAGLLLLFSLLFLYGSLQRCSPQSEPVSPPSSVEVVQPTPPDGQVPATSPTIPPIPLPAETESYRNSPEPQAPDPVVEDAEPVVEEVPTGPRRRRR